jgi:hypothetical protein
MKGPEEIVKSLRVTAKQKRDHRYNVSEKGRARSRRYQAQPEIKEHRRWKRRSRRTLGRSNRAPTGKDNDKQIPNTARTDHDA